MSDNTKIPLSDRTHSQLHFETSKMSRFILSSLRNSVRTLTLNRPERNNAMCESMYNSVTDTLNADASNNDVTLTIITGTDKYFSSGNDLKAIFEQEPTPDKENMVKDMITAMIDYPKLLMAVVNGPAIGIAATMVGLCDIVYASDRASFDAPFVRLGLCAEGCSSLVFPRALGRSKASEVLLLNHKLTAQEAHQFGLVSRVVPHDTLPSFIEDLHKYGKLPVKSLMTNKTLLMANIKDQLKECNDREFTTLRECVQSEDFTNAMQAFMNRKSKL